MMNITLFLAELGMYGLLALMTLLILIIYTLIITWWENKKRETKKLKTNGVAIAYST